MGHIIAGHGGINLMLPLGQPAPRGTDKPLKPPAHRIDMPNAKISTALCLTCLCGALTPTYAEAQDPAVFWIGGAAVAAVLPGFLLDLRQPDAGRAFIKASGGSFDAVDDENQAIDLMIEYQPGVTWHRVKPQFGLAGNSDGTFYGWVSAGHDFHIRDRFVVNVNTGPAFYLSGPQAKNLGSAGVLRSGFELGYRFSTEARATVSFHHMSHGKVMNGDLNPGTEMIAVNLSLPIN